MSRGAFGAWLPSRKAILQMPPGRRLGKVNRGKGRILETLCESRAENQTFRLAQPAPAPQGPAKLPTVDFGDSATIAEVIALLSNLGVSDALLQQVKSNIDI